MSFAWTIVALVVVLAIAWRFACVPRQLICSTPQERL